jgi:poly(beta-D-mannuronate) lyase
MEGLKGTRFGGALVVMNGVPNGPINRYDPVINARIENNSIINSDNIQLGAGSDEERSGVPEDSTFESNLIYHEDGRDVFTIYDDMSGIDFKNNVLVGKPSPELTTGFDEKQVALSRGENGLLYPQTGLESGAARDLKVTSKDMTGVTWFPKAEPTIAFASGKTINIEPREKALSGAIEAAEAGDVIVLSAGDYVANKFLRLDKPLTIKGTGEVNLTFERTAMFEILNGGSLQLINVNISGDDSPDYAGNSVIRTSPYSMLRNYRLEIIDSDFRDIDTNHSFNIVTAAKGTFADNILIKNSTFENVSGAILKLDKEIEDYGIYNAEYLTIEDSRFKNVGHSLVDYYRGGRDESTFGPHFALTNSTLSNIGKDKRNKSEASIFLHGVQVTNMSGNTFEDGKPFLINHTVGEPKTVISGNKFVDMPAPKVFELNSGLPPTAVIENNEGLTP